jgi:tetratricopeptide (TPR) repeat protein
MMAIAMRITARSVGLVVRLALALALAALVSLAAARADDFTNNEALDALFAELRSAPDAQAAHVIDQQIWFYWFNPVDPELARRMRQVGVIRALGDQAGAIVLLNRLVEDYPGYAEGWNQRATLLYVLGNFEASIADCEKVLELEPRHFGALSGRATMYLLQGKRALALKDMAAALAVHPFISGRELFPELAKPEMTHI